MAGFFKQATRFEAKLFRHMSIATSYTPVERQDY
jgi:hypothetical protein